MSTVFNTLIGRAVRVAALMLTVLTVTEAAAPARAAQSSSPAQRTSAAKPPPARNADRSILNDDYVRTQGRRGLKLLYNMKFDRANAIFDRIARRYPEHPVGPFMKALDTWWQILLDLNDPSHDDAFYDAMDEVIERSDEMLDEHPDSQDAAFFKGAALGFRGRLHSDRHHWFRAAYDAKRAMDLVLGLAEENPQNDDFIFGKGIYDYYSALVRERYTVAKALMAFFPEGNKERGLRELRRTADKGWFLQTEATYFLLQINYRYKESYSKSLQNARWLREHYPQNPFFHNFEGRVYAKWGRWDKAQAVFDKVLARHAGGRTGYNDHQAAVALYYMGRSYLAHDEYRKALNYFVRLERITSGEEEGEESFYRTLGRLRQGMVYDALGQRAAARQRYESVLEMQDHAEAHKRAERFLKDAYGG